MDRWEYGELLDIIRVDYQGRRSDSPDNRWVVWVGSDGHWVELDSESVVTQRLSELGSIGWDVYVTSYHQETSLHLDPDFEPWSALGRHYHLKRRL